MIQNTLDSDVVNASPHSDARLWFRQHRSVYDPRLRLVCFPHAGGSANFFRLWKRWLPPDLDLLAVRYPAREDRLNEPCITRMDKLADGIANAATSLLDRPLAFFGHSMGASIAHEVAVRLQERHGKILAGLFVSARPAPHRLRPSDLWKDTDEALLAEVSRLDPAGCEVLDDPDVREVAMPAIRGDYELVGTYRPDTIAEVRAPLIAYAADADPAVMVDEVEAWSAVARGCFTFRVFSGDHFYLVPRGFEVAEDVGKHLQRLTE